MTTQEKALYHQIHPLKLLADIGAEVVSDYLFWRRKAIAGSVAGLAPPVVASALVMSLVDLEPYKRSALGRYVGTYMTPPAVAARMLGTVVTHTGAWYHRPTLIAVGLAVVLLAWLRGVLWPGPIRLPGGRGV